MTFKYIARVYLLSKALSKVSLTSQELYTLYAVQTAHPARFTDVNFTLIVNKITKTQIFTIKYLKQLIVKEFISRKGYIYTITPKGTTALYEVEKRLRDNML